MSAVAAEAATRRGRGAREDRVQEEADRHRRRLADRAGRRRRRRCCSSCATRPRTRPKTRATTTSRPPPTRPARPTRRIRRPSCRSTRSSSTSPTRMPTATARSASTLEVDNALVRRPDEGLHAGDPQRDPDDPRAQDLGASCSTAAARSSWPPRSCARRCGRWASRSPRPSRCRTRPSRPSPATTMLSKRSRGRPRASAAACTNPVRHVHFSNFIVQ